MKKLSLTLLTVALLASPVANAAPTAAPSAKEVSELFKVLEEQRKQLDAQKKQMEAQQRKLDQLQKQITEISRQKSTTKTASDETSTTQQPRDAFARSETPTEVGIERKPEESESPPEIAADLDAGGVLLKKGQLVLTPAVEYTRSSSTLVAVEGWNTLQVLNIGTFQISRVGRDVITGSVAARVGITNRFELEGKVPYIYRRDSTTGRPVGSSGTDNTTRATGDGIGDIELGAHYQINTGKGGWPFFIANLRAKSTTGEGPFEIPTDGNGLLVRLPTGTGFYGIQPSVTAIYPSDPVVYYGNLGYTYNIARDFGGTVGRVEPGDSISAAFGMSMSLNDRASFSIGYSHSSVFETEQNNVSLTGDMLQVGMLDLGYAYQLNNRYSLNFNVSAGLTEDAPDARIGVRVPIRLNVF